MVIQGRNRCVFAGLAAAVWALPSTAQALTLGSVVVDDTPVALGAGFVAGAVLASAILGTRNRKLSRRIEALETKMTKLEQEPAKPVGRHAARSGSANFTLRNPEATSESVADDTFATSTASYAATSPERAEAGRRKAIEHTASFRSVDAARVPAIETSGADVAPCAARSEAAPTPASQAATRQSFSADAAPRRVVRDLHVPGDDLTLSASMSAATPAQAAAKKAGDDYERIATEYVEKQNFATRMANRAKGVAQLLGERLNVGAMDGMPVIERADGSVGDVGTSWWETAQHEAHREIATSFEHTFAGAVPAGEDFTTNAVMMGNPAAVAVAMTTGRWDIVTPDAKPAAAPEAKEAPAAEKNWRVNGGDFDIVGVSGRVARVVPTIEPDPKGATHALDDWEKSLAAMDNRVDDNLMSSKPGPFVDFVGDSSSIDEPDGLEPATNFLTFRTPAGHPEVQDTASYINFLVNSELGGTVKHSRKHMSATGSFEVCR